MNESESIAIPSPEYKLDQQLGFMKRLHTATGRVYHLDKQQWLYSLDTREALITKDEITEWWVRNGNNI